MNWEELHREGERPWDLKGVTPMLKFFFESEAKGKELLASKGLKRILVPGCGQKYDSEYLASIFKGAKVIGADISPTAVKTCQSETAEIENLKFIEADFFDDLAFEDEFDLIFDHTFFCAIKPEMRSLWGERMKSLLGKRKGFLLTIIYPLPRDSQRGPNLKEGTPFEVDYEAYERVLSDELACCGRWTNEQVPISNEKRKGREELALWRHK